MEKKKRRKRKMSKCPACGYQYSKFNRSYELRQLYWELEEIDKDYVRAIKKVSKLIRKHIPSENQNEYEYQLVKGIKDKHTEAAKWAINWYVKDKCYETGKGFNYLKSIIQNHIKDRAMLKKAELKKLGKSPKNLKIKRKELGFD